MTRSRLENIGKLLAWFRARCDHIKRSSAQLGSPKSMMEIINELRRRRYPPGQWRR